jgi:hypothetical protein
LEVLVAADGKIADSLITCVVEPGKGTAVEGRAVLEAVDMRRDWYLLR